ncbi:MAG: winged helix DNA-binding protein [Bacteroidia bacterium]
MIKAVELITELASFDEKHPNSSLEDFCRYYLASKSEQRNKHQNTTPSAPATTIDFKLMRLVNRIVKLHSIYAIKATDGTGINTSEEFSLLNSIDCLNEPRKTEAIYNALFELSTGIDMLNRLKKIGYITEYDDTEDKRSKRIKITAKGYKALATCRKRMGQLAEIEFFDLSEDEKKICIQLLSSVDAKFSALWQSHRGVGFDEVYDSIVKTTNKKK